MHIPQHFRLPDDHLAEVLARVNVGNLVTVHDDGPRATMVPCFVERRGEADVLVTHLVRNNPQAREPITGKGMVILDLSEAYVSPSWYATDEQMPNVPTWDYATVHLTGEVRVDPSPDAARSAAEELTRRMGEDQVMGRVGEERLAKMARAIVAVELTVERVDAKAKMSQNRHPEDVASVADAMEAHGHDDVAKYLREVSLPYAQARFALIDEVRADRELRLRTGY